MFGLLRREDIVTDGKSQIFMEVQNWASLANLLYLARSLQNQLIFACKFVGL